MTTSKFGPFPPSTLSSLLFGPLSAHRRHRRFVQWRRGAKWRSWGTDEGCSETVVNVLIYYYFYGKRVQFSLSSSSPEQFSFYIHTAVSINAIWRSRTAKYSTGCRCTGHKHSSSSDYFSVSPRRFSDASSLPQSKLSVMGPLANKVSCITWGSYVPAHCTDSRCFRILALLHFFLQAWKEQVTPLNVDVVKWKGYRLISFKLKKQRRTFRSLWISYQDITLPF